MQRWRSSSGELHIRLSFLQTWDRFTRQLSEMHEMMAVRTSSGSDSRVEGGAAFEVVIKEDVRISCHVMTVRGGGGGGGGGGGVRLEFS